MFDVLYFFVPIPYALTHIEHVKYWNRGVAGLTFIKRAKQKHEHVKNWNNVGPLMCIVAAAEIGCTTRRPSLSRECMRVACLERSKIAGVIRVRTGEYAPCT